MIPRLVLIAATAFVAGLVPTVQAGTCSTGLTSSNPESVYTLQADGTALHVPTGLVWKRCSEGQVWNGVFCEGIVSEDPSVIQLAFTWDAALDRAKSTRYAGQSDWRLPNIKELRSLVEECRGAAAINEKVFPQSSGGFYWSDSPFSGYSPADSAWGVNFYDGSAYNLPRSQAAGMVRLVRAGQTFDALRFALTVSGGGSGAGVVTAASAGLNCTVNAGAASGSCAADVDRDLLVTLSATAATGSVFTGWSGACTGTSVCAVSMSAAQAVTASFGSAPAPTVPACTLSASAVVLNAGEAVTLTPSCTPAATSFVWTGGACAGSSAAQCVDRPVQATTYTVAGLNGGGTGTPASVSVDVSSTQRPTCTLSATPSSVVSGGVATLSALCTPTPTSYVWTGGSCAGATGASCVVNPTSTTSYSVAGVNSLGTGATSVATVTVTGGDTPTQRPVCTVTASPASVTTGGASTLNAVCSPAASAYVWTGGSCAGLSNAQCTVTPTVTTSYTVAGVNEAGTGPSAGVTVVLTSAATAFTINADGTATDPRYGLIWMRCAPGQTLSANTCSGTASVYTWDQARALTGAYTFAGATDWRLPNVRELQTLVDRARLDPAIDTNAFPAAPNGYVWSSTSHAMDTSSAWTVVFGAGDARKDAKSLPHPVRLVRGGPTSNLMSVERPVSDYVDPIDGTLAHTPSGLTWQRCAVGQSWTGSTCSGEARTMGWSDAMLQTSTFAGKSDWRLPTQDELLSLMDYSLPGYGLSSVLFPGTSGSSFWSGTPYANASSAAWSAYFTNGETYHGQVTDLRSVRLVRGRATPALASFSATLETDTDKVFNWAERSYPQLFSPAGQMTQTAVFPGYRVRYYPATQSYLGVNASGEHHLFYLGVQGSDGVLDLGLLSGWVSRAGQ